jgi:hypothetical protein
MGVVLAAVLFGITVKPARAIAQGGPTALSAEVLGGKAFLEDLLNRRYSQDLSSLVDRTSFSLSAQLEIVVVQPPKAAASPAPRSPEPAAEPLNDLLLGTLDPESLLLNRPVNSESAQPLPVLNSMTQFLRGFRIRTVNITVGLRDELSAETKASVDSWLSTRLRSEFGAAGKGKVVTLQVAPKKQETEAAPKTALERLGEFQGLAGQILIAFAILTGVLLFQLLGRRGANSTDVAKPAAAPMMMPSAAPASSSSSALDDAKLKREQEEFERQQAVMELERIRQNMRDLVPRLSVGFEEVIKAWCRMGEPGKLRLAAFAEAVGQQTGRLPIPVDALPDIQRIFLRMPEMSMKEKVDALRKGYWDLLAVLNLGSDALNQPFSYVGGLKPQLVNQMLIDQNAKMRTLVSIHMPNDLRTRYMASLQTEQKLELLRTAADLNSIRQSELKSMDTGLASRLKAPESEDAVVPLDMTLNRLIESLTPTEEITLVPQLTGASIDAYMKATPSLAFLDRWSDERLKLLFSRTTIEEMIAYVRVREDMVERILSLSPPMKAQILKEELDRKAKLSDRDRNRQLQTLTSRLKEMVRLQEVHLEDMFNEMASNQDASSVKSAA